MSLQSVSRNIADNVRAVRHRIADAAAACGREPDSVHLVAVSKTHPAPAIREAAAAGCAAFGENYLQEALSKIHALDDVPALWHFIGDIQSNKTRAIAEHFHWVHTVSRARTAERLSRQCPPGKTLNVTVQVNIDRDPAKTGVDPEATEALLQSIGGLDNLRVRGLMTVLRRGSPSLDSYRRLALLFDELQGRAPRPWDTLSMGMSGDFREAITAGATHVRVGTAIFGPRAHP